MKDVCHSPLFFMSLIIRFISSPLPSGRLKAFFTGLWGFGSNKAKDADTQTYTHTHEGTAELSLVRGKCNHKGLIIQTQNTHTHSNTHNLVPSLWQAIVLWDCVDNLFMND